MVNRLWQAHFGTGFVETASDFGFNGGKPSHPELLDWLAAEVVAQGFSLKAMHRLILSPRQLSGSRRDPTRSPSAEDAGNRFFWQRPPVRLQAEMVRDAMLSVAGVLDSRLGGPSFFDHSVHKAPGTAAILYASIEPGAPGPIVEHSSGHGCAAAEAICSTPSTARIRRPRRRGGPSRPLRCRPCR